MYSLKKYTEEQLKEIIQNAICILFRKQPNIFEFTSESGHTEWNFAHHLANELHFFFPEYDCDLEITKHCESNKTKRPDIIYHRRGNHDNNFLVVELKLHEHKEDDKEKIKSYFFSDPLNYAFGAAIKIDVGMKDLKNIDILVNPNLP